MNIRLFLLHLNKGVVADGIVYMKFPAPCSFIKWSYNVKCYSHKCIFVIYLFACRVNNTSCFFVEGYRE